MTKAVPSADVFQSLAIRRQRALLDVIGTSVGTPVVYLKAAWADPVFYGGRGERSGVDLDVLVRPSRFIAFASALSRRGFRRINPASHPISALLGKDWTFRAPPGYMVVDLHRALAIPPWFDMPGEAPLSRAEYYDSVDGPILSLSPEDQVVFFAAHCSTHVFELDERHLEDTVRLLANRSVDWRLVIDRASQAHLKAALSLAAFALQAKGVDVPNSLLRPGGSLRARLAWLRQFVEVPGLGRRIRLSSRGDIALVMPMLSDRVAALPRFLVHYTATRAADWLARRML